MISNLEIAISTALKADDDQNLMELLSIAHSKKLSEIYSIAYALTAMMPPFEDYDIATKALSGLFGCKGEKIAAIFLGYLYVNLQPFDDGFAIVLKKYNSCSISNYILALYFDYEGNFDEAKKYIDASLSLSHFAKNILFKLSMHSSDLNDAQRERLKREISILVTDKCYEHSAAPESVADLVDSYLKELVIGSYMTSINWDNIKSKYNL